VPTPLTLPPRAPIVRKLYKLAAEFDQAANYYQRLDGSHNDLLHHECVRAAAQLRTVARGVAHQTTKQEQGVDWLRAGWRIITAIGRSNIT